MVSISTVPAVCGSYHERALVVRSSVFVVRFSFVLSTLRHQD